MNKEKIEQLRKELIERKAITSVGYDQPDPLVTIWFEEEESTYQKPEVTGHSRNALLWSLY